MQTLKVLLLALAVLGMAWATQYVMTKARQLPRVPPGAMAPR